MKSVMLAKIAALVVFALSSCTFAADPSWINIDLTEKQAGTFTGPAVLGNDGDIWNRCSAEPGTKDVPGIVNLLDVEGNPTAVSFQLAGATVGLGAGLGPRQLYYSFHFVSQPETATITLEGLEPDRFYDLYLYSSKGLPAHVYNHCAVFTFGSVTKEPIPGIHFGLQSIDYDENANYVIIRAMADNQGRITGTMARAKGRPNPVAVINGIQITKVADRADDTDKSTGHDKKVLKIWRSKTCLEHSVMEHSVKHNDSNESFSYRGATWAPGQLSLDPGPQGQYSVVRWTAPAKGEYKITAEFLGISHTPVGVHASTPYTTVDMHILHEDNEIYNGFINIQDQGNVASYSGTIEVKERDKVDFIVGKGDDGPSGDTTALELMITASDGKVYNAAADFSLSSNPNGVWTYGYLAPGVKPSLLTFTAYDKTWQVDATFQHHSAGLWASEPPADCPFKPSKDITGIAFTGKRSNYRVADTWYPSWASDGNMYSPWTDGSTPRADGVMEGAASFGDRATTGQGIMIGDDPLNLKLHSLGITVGYTGSYQGRYPCGSLVYNGVWYYGTYCLGPSAWVDYNGRRYNWPILGPVPGFRVSTDYGKTWTETPHTSMSPLFPEPTRFMGPVKIGKPHFVDFGKNMEHSPDGKAYLVGHGAEVDDPMPRYANLSWGTADQINIIRVVPSIKNINDESKYEYFAGHDKEGNPVWSYDFKDIKPLLEWNNNMGCVSMTYNAPLKKYLMCVTDAWPTTGRTNSYVLESDAISGPFKLVTYMKDFGQQGYFLNIPSKFISKDGKTAWLCYSANFSLGVDLDIQVDPPGSDYGLILQEIKLLGASEKISK